MNLINEKVTKTVYTRWAQGKEAKEIELTLDFFGCSLEQILKWAARDRIIQFQRNLRNMNNEDEFNKFCEVGEKLTIFAFDAHLPFSEHTTVEELIQKIKEEEDD